MGLLADVFGENYKYYDTPDGEDCFDKLFYVSKYAACYGILWSSIDVILASKPVGYGPTLARYAAITVPAIAVPLAWSASICAATNIRKKDDYTNYAIGGIGAGATLGAALKSVKVGSYSALVFAALSTLYKDHLVSGWDFVNLADKKRIHNGIWSVNHDFTITKDYPKTWTTKDQ